MSLDAYFRRGAGWRVALTVARLIALAYAGRTTVSEVVFDAV